MFLAPAENRISREKYLEGELVSEICHEYVAGNVYVMSGGTLNHQRIAGNFQRLAGATSLPENPVSPLAAISNSTCRSGAAMRLFTTRTA